LAYGFSNSFRDASTIVASVVSTRALAPLSAFGLCAVFEFLGAWLFGSRIAGTISSLVTEGKALAPHDVILVLTAAIAASFVWSIVSWVRGWPMSSSQALIGSLTGAGCAAWGPERLFAPKLLAVFVVLVVTPTLGFLLSAALTSGLRQLGFWMTTAARPVVQSLHVLGCLMVSAAHGSNNGQIIVGFLAVAAATMGSHAAAKPSSMHAFVVAVVIAVGVLLGGRRLLHKLAMKFYRIRDMQGLGAQSAASLAMAACLMTGFPASPTHLISGSIVGAGVAKSVRSVRWTIVAEIVLSWIVTIPVNAAFAAFLFHLFRVV
jgi:PiT family inorganic phosphate transporter